MLGKVKTEVFYPYPPQHVWQVLTNSRALAAWLMDNDFEPRVGHKFQFWSPLPGLDRAIHCQVLELDEPKRLAYTWQESLMQHPSIVTWTLIPVRGGTQLQLEHQGVRQEAIALEETQRSTQTWQSQFMYEAIEVTQTLAPIPRHTSFQSIPIGRYEALDSVILNSLLTPHTLKERLPQVLVSLTANK